MERFGQQCPEIPVARGAAQTGFRIGFYGMVKVGELERVAQEKHRGVVSNEVPVPFVGIELHGEPADIALGICGATFSCHGRKSHQAFGFLSDFGKD